MNKCWIWGQDAGNSPFEQQLSGSLGEGFVSAVQPQIILPSSVCSDTFPWQTLKRKFGFNFFNHFFCTAIVSRNTAHPKELQQKALGLLDHISRPFSHSPESSQQEKGDITVSSQEQAGSSNMTMDLSPFSSPLPQFCSQKEINPHRNNLITQALSHRALKRGITLA